MGISFGMMKRYDIHYDITGPHDERNEKDKVELIWANDENQARNLFKLFIPNFNEGRLNGHYLINIITRIEQKHSITSSIAMDINVNTTPVTPEGPFPTVELKSCPTCENVSIHEITLGVKQCDVCDKQVSSIDSHLCKNGERRG